MLEWLRSIGEFLLALVGLLISFVQGIAQLIAMIPSALAMTTSSIASMPLVLTAFAVGLISVSVVYLIIGR